MLLQNGGSLRRLKGVPTVHTILLPRTVNCVNVTRIKHPFIQRALGLDEVRSMAAWRCDRGHDNDGSIVLSWGEIINQDRHGKVNFNPTLFIIAIQIFAIIYIIYFLPVKNFC